MPADRFRILLVAPPLLPVPPPSYAGTERVIAVLGEQLHARGHEVALVSSGDSEVPYEHIPTVEQSLWSSGYRGDVASYMQHTTAVAWREAHRFDLVHAHLENHSFLLARYAPVPVVTTLHGRLDAPGMPELLGAFTDVPLVAISRSQRRWYPDQNWVATIHHGLPLDSMPFSERHGEYLAFVGRSTPEKGIAEAVELARRTKLPLRIAAKVYDDKEKAHFDAVVTPAVDAGLATFLGELGPEQRDPLYAGARATLMLGGWPEPFGLVAIESMATGTPVIARRAGALTETIEHGVTGFLVDDVNEAELALERVADLDRALIRAKTLERFSVERMTDEYEAVYRQLVRAPSARRVAEAALPG
ncbi:MAG TPA: glycosyltransferase family 4 protein [Candidatus Limnocylindrales bacterium]|nr:glycosyltransferase family 4 protein [Candidatus Limnocylindrales bacterium]